ncbi:MAG: GatB/YqeY domain-containing protein [Vulcanimicrobiaceae bacterium]
MSLKDRIAADLKDAMRAKDRDRLDALRSTLSAFSYRRIEAGRELEEAEQIEVVRKQVRQRGDSIVEFERGGRQELAAKERREQAILEALLPAQTDPETLRGEVRRTLEALPPGERAMGPAMKAVMPALRGRADGSAIRTLVEQELAALGGA